MLRRVNGALFEAGIGDRVQIVARLASSPTSSAATFEYADDIVTNDPGTKAQCTLDIEPGINQFQAFVLFATGSPASARYDLFELDGGTLEPLEESVSASASLPVIGFGIQGIAAALAAPVPSGPAPGPVAKAVKAAKKAAVKKATVKKVAAKKAATKKTAVKKSAARKAAAKKGAAKKSGVKKSGALRKTAGRPARKKARRR